MDIIIDTRNCLSFPFVGCVATNCSPSTNKSKTKNEKEQPLIENQVKNGNQKGEAQEVEETVLDGLEMAEEEDL